MYARQHCQQLGAGETAEVAAVILADARHEEAHRLRRRLIGRGLSRLLSDRRPHQCRESERQESELDAFHTSPKSCCSSACDADTPLARILNRRSRRAI
jgi:hypothetical protein